jgi:hypothetical protein
MRRRRASAFDFVPGTREERRTRGAGHDAFDELPGLAGDQLFLASRRHFRSLGRSAAARGTKASLGDGVVPLRVDQASKGTKSSGIRLPANGTNVPLAETARASGTNFP